MDTLSTTPTRTTRTPRTAPARRVRAPEQPEAGRLLDLTQAGPLDALREAYADRLALLAARAPEDALARSAQRVRALEEVLRPVGAPLRRSGPDPATFLG
ncbi:hypothetical protein [Kineococcus gypseus]|uniref:hypothetical protein n=1 Tax=Kineococcus gypseus TaxID=1637102 RepID=UPI003D7D5EBB